MPYKKNTDKQERKKELGVPCPPIDIIMEEFNRIESKKNKMIEVIVFSDSEKNGIRFSVQKPATINIVKRENEIALQIINKLFWVYDD